MYKVGDKVIIKTWDELVNEFKIVEGGSIKFKYGWHWNKGNDSSLPKNRIVTIEEISDNNWIWISPEPDRDFVISEMIKCHTNEYYLQEIKDELQNRR